MTSSHSVCVLVLIFCVSIVVVVTERTVSTSPKIQNSETLVNFLTRAVLPDGESETRMRFRDIIVREASIVKTNEAGIREGLLLRQLALGPHYSQHTYKVGQGRVSKREVMNLLECEMVNDWNSADQFRNHFRKDVKRAGVNLPVPPNQSHMDALKVNSESNKIEDEFSLEQLELAERGAFDQVEQFKNFSLRILRNGEIVGDLQHSFDIIAHQRECKRFHRKLKKSLKQTAKNIGVNENNPEDENQEGEHLPRRVRREAFKMGIMPGTLWCGDGSLAHKYEDVGAHVGTDRCCREHDGCPFIIPGLTSNYGLFNYRMHTISHCSCDERFRSCLKQTNTGSSNFAGKFFFNIVQTMCFVLKPEKTCSRRSWWGKCLKYEFKTQAHLRDHIPY